MKESPPDGYTSEGDLSVVETDEDSQKLRLRQLPTDDTRYSPFAIYGGSTIEHIRQKIRRRRVLHKIALGRSYSAESFSGSLQPAERVGSMTSRPMSSGGTRVRAHADSKKIDLLSNVTTVSNLIENGNFLKRSKYMDHEHFVYSWLPDDAERLYVNSGEMISTGYQIRERELTHYQLLINYSRTDCHWHKDEDGELILKHNKPVLNVKKHAIRTGRSSYISWVLDESSELSKKTKVFTLPTIEHIFWTKMVNLKNGYLRVIQKSGDREEIQKEEEAMRKGTVELNFNQLYNMFDLNISKTGTP